jgi:hypothetical protein
MSITSWHKLMSASNLEDVLEVTLRIPMYNKYALEKGMDRDQYHEFIAKGASELILNELKNREGWCEPIKKVDEEELAETREFFKKMLNEIGEVSKS